MAGRRHLTSGPPDGEEHLRLGLARAADAAAPPVVRRLRRVRESRLRARSARRDAVV